MTRLVREYIDWLSNKVYDPKFVKRKHYGRLMTYLFDKEFIYIIPMDENRAEDGIALRYDFASDMGYDASDISMEILNRPCSMLEMMVALADRIETHIMGDPGGEDNPGQWFWTMIVNLGLGGMIDKEFSSTYCDMVVDKCNNREYLPNGENGGLFVVNDPSLDLRNVEIWYQMNWYLNEIINYR